MTGELRLTRRGVLGVAGATLVGGCSALDSLGSGPTLDAAAVAEITGRDTPTVAKPLPGGVAADHLAAARAGAESDLDSAPLPLSATDVPNGVVRALLEREVEYARESLGRATDAVGVRDRLDALRHAREHARYVAAAWAAANEDLTVEAVRERAATVRSDLADFREDRAYVGEDPVRATLVHGAVDEWTVSAGRHGDLADERFEYDPASAPGVGERAREVEYARAVLDDARHVHGRFTDSLSDSPSVRPTLVDARKSLSGETDSRLAELPPADATDPATFADTERDLEETVAAVVLDDLHFRLPHRLEPDDALAADVLERLAGLAHVGAFERFRDRIEAGEEFGVESVDELAERRETAVEAVEQAIAESPDRRLARHVLADRLWRIIRTDEELRNYDDRVRASGIRWEVGEYVAMAMLARSVPAACRTTLDALGIEG
jgi:hypothetical protein